MPNLLSHLFKRNLSALHAAILVNNTNKIRHILNVEQNCINKQLDSAGDTALLLAIKYTTSSTVKLLLKHGAHPDQPNFVTHQTPLSLLASTIYEDDQEHEANVALEMATILLDDDADVDKTSSFYYLDENDKEYMVNETPLMTAVRTKNIPMATLLLDSKANINYIDKQTGSRPIHLSIINGDEEMFDLLENAGASCRTGVINDDNTLLHWFCSNDANDQHGSLLKKLIDISCDVNAENNLQRTPLMLAAQLNMINTCETLINASADVDKVDDKGNRAIDLAELGSECFRLLLHTTHVQQMKSSSHQQKNRILCTKHVVSHRSLFSPTNESKQYFNDNKNKVKNDSSNTTNENQKHHSSNHRCRQQDNDSTYRRMWKKILNRKHAIMRTKDLSLQKTKDNYEHTINHNHVY
ncbi:unnamed protein product [Adineta steineri]|uniref:Uncharacterized protein n=1 Tax=Adineta steineri TaxID=433720 RepID=A0A814Y4N8_9BILA|nr:unnamed protein product [Adineta steineri]CAF1224595.1 unnamed protein product [Adineta steineri]